ncbi:MAG: hypothetical protein A3A44_00085 [Candidatus Sungbacteria bacterium RIFCSPLOWO2_01_FULL_60_25]|uniref:Uncharacterized protein n=1 Tax=Candidatus Sungbacteria bacterium RIFCSPLOWO2_01_FULL_60_25 TaxID=1802281 RepID=A0A1G2LBC4_9BACT|nr:MAG: hypothetical protein A3A44_00085 [Candidatus Sungbacteria bacterium RIFCSPLOWO2_01_FULL_60_25]
MARRKVAIVAAGEWKGIRREKGTYDTFESTLQIALDVAEVRKAGTSGGTEKATEVRVVTSVEEARAWIGSERGTMVFSTRGMLREADKLAEELQGRVRIVLLTGDLPEDRPIVLSKRWKVPLATLCGIIVGAPLAEPK